MDIQDYIMSKNEKIKVLVLITVMDRAGAETMMMNYFRNIDRDKIQIDFLINRDDKADYEEEVERLGSHIYHMCPLFPGKFRKYQKEFKRFLQEHPGYDIVHSHLEERSYYALKISKKMGIPVRIVHAHSVPQGRNLKMIARKYFRWRLKKYYTYAFACGMNPAKWLFGTTENVVIMKNAVDTTCFQYSDKTRDEMRKALGIHEKQLVVGHIGRFIPEKNQKFLVDIFQNVNNYRKDSILLLIGGGKPKTEVKYKKEVIEKVQKLGLQDKVRFLGVRDDIEGLLQAIDVLVMPSVSEGFPVTLVEAQSSGLRCLASDVVSNDVNVTETIQYMSLEEDEAEWANKILAMETEELPRKEMASKVKEAGLDIKENSEWLEEFYENCKVLVSHKSSDKKSGI